MKHNSYIMADFPYFCLKSALLLFAWCRLLLSIAFLQFLPRVLPPPLSVTLVCTTAPAQYIPSSLLSTHLSYPLSPSSALVSSVLSVFCILYSSQIPKILYPHVHFLVFSLPPTPIFLFCSIFCILCNNLYTFPSPSFYR